jgi:hypothetical protein
MQFDPGLAEAGAGNTASSHWPATASALAPWRPESNYVRNGADPNK